MQNAGTGTMFQARQRALSAAAGPLKQVLSSWLVAAAFLLLLCASAQATPLKVFVSIAPQKWLADQVGGALVTTRVLVDRGQEPHDFEPTPRQIAALFQATLYFTMEMPFERQITRRISQVATGPKIVDVTANITRIPMADQGESSHRAALDPHVWLDPANVQLMATAMAAAFVATDPAHAAEYRENLEQLQTVLARLDADIRQMLKPYRGASFFVFHPAFGYFAHAYGLHQQAVEIAGKSPSPRQLSALVSQARTERVKVIFVQPQFDRKSATAIARAIGGEVVPLDPLAENLAANLQIMAEKIQTALGRP